MDLEQKIYYFGMYNKLFVDGLYKKLTQDDYIELDQLNFFRKHANNFYIDVKNNINKSYYINNDNDFVNFPEVNNLFKQRFNIKD